jgi:hypothetical protein
MRRNHRRLKALRARPVLAATILYLLATAMALGQNNKSSNTNSAKTRPIQDFLSTQTNSFPSLAASWSDPVSGRLAWVDYAGVMSQQIVASGGASLGTKMDGTVVERPLDDGTAEVTVLVHTTNAFVYVTDFPNLNPLFGNTPTDVAAGSLAGLGKCLLQVVFINSAPGAPLPDLLQAFSNPGGVRFVAMTSTATGPLNANFGVPDGTTGFFQMTQTGVLQSQGSGGPRRDFFPAEHIILTVAGR